MAQLFCRIGQVALFAVLVLPVPALALPAITCHCFTDRSYDATRPAAADAYFLAAAQNSFFANVFNVDKKSVVMKKQQGASADDLWVAYWVASHEAGDPDRLLQSVANDRSWKNVLAPMPIPQEKLGTRFSQALAANLPTNQLAAAVVDELMIGHLLLDENQLGMVRKAGASNQELILSAVLSSRMGRSAEQIFRDVKSGAGTWGTIFYATGIDGKNLPQVVADALKRRGSV